MVLYHTPAQLWYDHRLLILRPGLATDIRWSVLLGFRWWFFEQEKCRYSARLSVQYTKIMDILQVQSIVYQFVLSFGLFQAVIGFVAGVVCKPYATVKFIHYFCLPVTVKRNTLQVFAVNQLFLKWLFYSNIHNNLSRVCPSPKYARFQTLQKILAM